MSTRLATLVCSAGLLVCAVTGADAARGIIDLGTLPGDTRSEACGINNCGQVVGWSVGHDIYEPRHAFLWQNGVMQDLGVGEATAINNSGQVVGQFWYPSGGQACWYALLWQNGVVQCLGTLPGYEQSKACAINDSGQAVGWAEHASVDIGAFLWQNGTMQDLGTLGGANSQAFGINNVGQVVGHSYGSYGSDRPFLWRNGTMTDLGTLSGGYDTWAYGINDSGQVVGGPMVGREDPGYARGHAFLWQNVTMTDLGTLGGDRSCACGINNSGQVVGWAKDSVGNIDAFLWQNGIMTCLGARPGDVGSIATGINSSGWICGTSTDPAGKTHAVLWQPTIFVTIVNPTTNPIYVSENATVSISGTASDTDGTISKVSWSNSMGDGGDCSGTTSWSATGIALQPGDNVITVTASDADGNIGVGTVVVLTPAPIGYVRRLSTNSPAYIQNAVVTATTVDSAGVFVESADRSSGIKLLTSQSLAVGQRVSFTGTVARAGGEFQIGNVSLLSIADGSTLAPLGMTTRTIGNDPTEYLNYVGLNTTGLLVRFAGKVTGVGGTERIIYVDDGRNYQDGLMPVFGIRVYVPDGVALPAKGKKIVVTGISRVERFTLTAGAEVNGLLYSAGTVIYVPSVWVRDASDLVVL